MGGVILIIILFRGSSEKRAKNTPLERASHETFYDSMKWVLFGIFVVIYPSFLKENLLAFLITILVFVLVLFGLNILKEKSSPKN